MHARTDHTAARLGLEALEGRLLLSATLPAPVAAAAAAQHAAPAPIQIDYSHAAAVTHPKVTHPAPANVRYLFHWGVGPSPFLLGANTNTGNGKSTGSVDFALVRDGTELSRLGGPSGLVPIGLVVTTSSASASRPDRYNTTFTLQLRIKDEGSGAWRVLTFKGTVTGTLTWDHSSLTVKFQGPLTQKVTLGKHVYTVTIPGTVKPPEPGGAPALLYARVQVGAAPTLVKKK
jgi:hypothetical protein